VSKIQKYR